MDPNSSGNGGSGTDPLAKGSISLRLYPHDVPALAQVDELRAQARLAIEVGYDGVMVSEHHAGFAGYLPNPHQMIAFLLPVMPRGWAAASPILLPMLPYALLAEQLAWLAVAYPGRVGAGFGSGSLPVDFELAEVPFAEITDRFKAALPKIVAALRGEDPTPLGGDRAIRACKERPVPMCVAAQSKPAVRRAANLGIGVLYNSLQTNDVSRRMSDTYDEAGGTAPKILVRRVWIGDAPEAAIQAQIDHYKTYATENAMKSWGPDNSTIRARTGEELAELLAATIEESGCDAINVRVHVKDLRPDQVRQQLELHATEFLPHLRAAWSGAAVA
ncbi:MAG TPA: LLM class flavin-dependent oxidoreductase [Acidimicrobiales bacterium]|jgi:alkanesulfonate monooxygenase SsuD/methylene tetrahydromethanopterin reductase-like flavin-dependent oxidoreductase (luciferase family)|nr:LLM class flavin-dependent oxidoreductase [Acidimicrobiales bacterium]